MPRLFPHHFTSEQVQHCLTEHQQGAFPATPANAVHFPVSKGIYFWYMRPEGYHVLSQHLAFPQHFNGQTVDNQGNHLVYLGTAGTRLTKNNQSGLRDRFVWHVCNRHTVSQVCHGTLSTLRQTLGAVLTDDLIEVDGVHTEMLVNQFMSNYLTLSYIAYEGALPEVGVVIDDDEKKLIKTLKPLLNLKNNPNIAVPCHPTRLIKARGLVAKRSTKLRVCCP